MFLMKNVFLVATIAMVSEKFLFPISMVTIVRETIPSSNPAAYHSKLSLKNGIKQIKSRKIVTNMYLVLH